MTAVPVTPERLAELEALERRVKARPWRQPYPYSDAAIEWGDPKTDQHGTVVRATNDGCAASCDTFLDVDIVDAEFICALRNAAPDLFATVRQLRAALLALVEAVGEGTYHDESTASRVVDGVHYDGAWRCIRCDRASYDPHEDGCPLNDAVAVARVLLGLKGAAP